MNPRVVVYTRQDCHLCDVAIAVVEHVCAEMGEEFVQIDIDSESVLAARYSDDVPVVSVDGTLVARWRVSPRILRRALKPSLWRRRTAQANPPDLPV